MIGRDEDYLERPACATDPPVRRRCLACGQIFVFPEDSRELELFAKRGFPPPKRCPSCRAAAKREARTW